MVHESIQAARQALRTGEPIKNFEPAADPSPTAPQSVAAAG
jgi:hypothetical protein